MLDLTQYVETAIEDNRERLGKMSVSEYLVWVADYALYDLELELEKELEIDSPMVVDVVYLSVLLNARHIVVKGETLPQDYARLQEQFNYVMEKIRKTLALRLDN